MRVLVIEVKLALRLVDVEGREALGGRDAHRLLAVDDVLGRGL